MDKEQLPETKDQRGVIYDIFCATETKERIIVEVQYRHQPYSWIARFIMPHVPLWGRGRSPRIGIISCQRFTRSVS